MNTSIGGFISVIIKLILIIFFVSHMIIVFNYGETRTATKQILKSYFEDPRKYKLREGLFDIGLAYVSFTNVSVGENLLSDPTYFNVTFSNTEYHRLDPDFSQRHANPIALDFCRDRFVNYQVNKYNKIDRYLWPQDDQFYLLGNSKSEIFGYVEVLISLWDKNNTQGIVCKSDEELLNVAKFGFIDLIVVSSYFDFDDFDQPIKTQTVDDLYFYLNPDSTTWFDALVQVNEAYMSDNRLYGAPYDVKEFFSLSQKEVKLINKDLAFNSLSLITITNDPHTIRYERQVYSLFDMFGFLGGLYDFLLFVGFWLISTLQDKIFYNSIFSDLYQVKASKNNEDFDELYTTKSMFTKEKAVMPKVALEQQNSLNTSSNSLRLFSTSK